MLKEKRIARLHLERRQLVPAGAALLWWLSSFLYEGMVFMPGQAEANPMNYLLTKLLSLVVMYLLIVFFVDALKGIKAKSPQTMTLAYALLLFVPVTLFWSQSNAWPLGFGDQSNIVWSSVNYDTMGGFFNYLTMYVYMVAMNLVPAQAFCVVFKIFLVSLMVGVCIMRLRRICPSPVCFLLYAPFIIPPGFYQTYNLHRIPMYAPLYMLFSCLLICDRLEGKSLTKGKFVLLALMAAVLTQWRSEGIYLVVWAPLLLYFFYRPRLTKKTAALALAAMLCAQAMVQLPQSIESSRVEESPGGRSLPFFEFVITGMERKGLDMEKNAQDLSIVDKYIDLEALHELNKDGDSNYEDNVVIYHALRDDATAEDVENFKSAVIRIIIKNPMVYLRNQLSAWSHISTAFRMERKLDAVANIFQNLYVPTLWLLGLWVYLLVKKNWAMWFLTSGHLGHMLITTALLPASYFKYYYSEYLYAALTMVVFLLLYVKRKREQKEKQELRL